MTTVIGIDLGTSNCAMAVVEGDGVPKLQPIKQLLGSGLEGEADSLPSALYLTNQAERSQASMLPLNDSPYWFGKDALMRGTNAPDRVVLSAKSWLALSAVDRQDNILPWKSDAANKLSPVSASSLLISYLLETFEQNQQKKSADVDGLVVTVPASFDEVARQLTLEAIERAGAKATLLEEPLAAVYCWLANLGERWRDQLAPGDTILVVDVGGGTTDLSLITANDEGGHLQLERLAVGRHLLVGGDNMDLSIAYNLKKKLLDQGQALDSWQFQSMVIESRFAKETLLADQAPSEVTFSIASKSSDIFASSITISVTQEEIKSWLLEGFFPETTLMARPRYRQKAGIQEVGLQYEGEPEIPRHISQFLCSYQEPGADKALSGGVTWLKPTKILFNGGVFKSRLIRERVLDVLASWGAQAEELSGVDYDSAVAKGAAHYGELKRSGKGHRIAAGTARSYYLGLEEAAMAVPGMEAGIKGLCIVPQGTEEGTSLTLPQRTFGLVTGSPVEFRFFSSLARSDDSMGSVVDDAATSLDESNSIRMTLEEGNPGEMIPVTLKSVVNEVGTLDLMMCALGSERSWKLEFDLRGTDEAIYG